MKKFFSIKYSVAAFNFSMLITRIVFGILLIAKHGYMKMIHFSEMQSHFYSFMGLGSKLTLIIAIFVEVLCSLFIILGLFTRMAVIPLIILMLVVVFGADAGKSFAESEMSLMYLAAFVTLFFCGPGRISIDGMINK